jgi:hypothetical protein
MHDGGAVLHKRPAFYDDTTSGRPAIMPPTVWSFIHILARWEASVEEA